MVRRSTGRRAAGVLLVVAIAAVVVVAALAASAAAYLWYSQEGTQQTRTYSFVGFTSLSVGSALKVDVIRSNYYSIAIAGGEKLLNVLEVAQNGSTLTIAAKPGAPMIGFKSAEVTITMPQLESIWFSGATSGNAQGFNGGGPLAVTLSGASSLVMTNVQLGNVTLDLSGASSFTSTGSANGLVSTASGASSLNLANLTVNNANVRLDGASHAAIDANGRLDATLTGASSLQYSGSPTLGNISSSGASSVTKR